MLHAVPALIAAQIVRLTVVVLPLMVFTRPAFGDVMGLSTRAWGTFTLGTSPMMCNESGGPTAACYIEAVQASYDNPVNAVMDVSALATFGSLSGRARFGTTPIDGVGWEPALGFFRVEAIAGFFDTLTLDGFAGSGFIQYHISGEGYGSEGHNPRPHGFAINAPITWTKPVDGIRFGSLPVDYTSHLYPVIAGVPFTLEVNAGIGSDGVQEIGFGEFSLILDQITVFDANLNTISNYTLTAESGTVYPALGALAPIPEPSSIALLLTVICVIGSSVWRERTPRVKNRC